MAGAGAGMAAGAMMGRGRDGPPPVYESGYNGGDVRPPPPPGGFAPRNQSPAGYTPRNQSPAGYTPRNQPPPPAPAPMPHDSIGQAIEMDERTGSAGPGQYGLRDSDGDVAGIVALQQGRSSPMRNISGGASNPMSPVTNSSASMYSEQ